MSLNRKFVALVDNVITLNARYDFEGRDGEKLEDFNFVHGDYYLCQWDERDGAMMLLFPQGEIEDDVPYDCDFLDEYEACCVSLDGIVVYNPEVEDDYEELWTSNGDIGGMAVWNFARLRCEDSLPIKVYVREAGNNYVDAVVVKFGC